MTTLPGQNTFGSDSALPGGLKMSHGRPGDVIGVEKAVTIHSFDDWVV
jgi:acetyl-CoA carboxylase alpha subunit